MSILHGSWISEYKTFFVWGETWRSLVNFEASEAETTLNPFCLDPEELTSFLSSHLTKKKAPIQAQLADLEPQDLILNIPSLKASKTKPLVPVFSQNIPDLEAKDLKKLQLHPWQVNGLALSSTTAIALLAQLPLSKVDYLAAELSFWTQVYRWSLDLIVKGKFISGLDPA